jgi:hypothetical protein
MTRNLHPITVSFVFLVINVLILLVILAMNRRTGARSGQAAPSGQGTSEGGHWPCSGRRSLPSTCDCISPSQGPDRRVNATPSASSKEYQRRLPCPQCHPIQRMPARG